MPAKTPIKKSTRVLFRISGASLMLLAIWAATSGIHYDADKTGFPLETSGHFVFFFVWLPLPISFLFSGFFLLLSRWTGLRRAWTAMLLTGAILTGWAVYEALPRGRLKSIIGEAATDACTLERLRIHHTFGEGQFRAGVLSGDPGLMTLIQQHRPLERRFMTKGQQRYFEGWFRDVAFAEGDEVWADEVVWVWADPQEHKVYFVGPSWERGKSLLRNPPQTKPPQPVEIAPQVPPSTPP